MNSHPVVRNNTEVSVSCASFYNKRHLAKLRHSATTWQGPQGCTDAVEQHGRVCV